MRCTCAICGCNWCSQAPPLVYGGGAFACARGDTQGSWWALAPVWDTGGMVQTVDFRGVPLCKAGEWNGLTGKVAVTPDDLAAVVDAYNDPEVDRPRLKLGHVSDLNALGDGAPAFGWVESPRLSDGGKTLVGDLVDVPRQLGELVGRAYKDVSVEMRRGVKTPSGKTHPIVLSGLALLGVAAPAVKNLGQLAALYASEAPGGGPEDECTESGTVTIALGDALYEVTRPEIPASPDVPGDSGGERPDQPGRDKEDADMAFLSEARKALGLSDDTPEGEVMARITALSEAPEPQGEVQAQEVDVTPAPTATDEPAAKSQAAPETVVVSKAVLDDMNTKLAALTAEAEKRQAAEAETHRETVLDTALSQGRITPAEREHWAVALSQAPEVNEKLILSLAPRVNTTEVGSDVALSAGGDTDDENFNAWADQVGF